MAVRLAVGMVVGLVFGFFVGTVGLDGGLPGSLPLGCMSLDDVCCLGLEFAWRGLHFYSILGVTFAIP